MAKTFGKIQTKESTVEVAEGLSISIKNHDKLLEYVKKRLEFGCVGRDARIDRFTHIDKEIAGYLKLDDDDRKRLKDNLEGKSPKPTDFHLELVWAKLDDFLTYLMSVLSPDEGLYSSVTAKDEQDIANGFMSVLDKHASLFKHYPEIAKAVYDMVKYNFGGWAPIEWKKVIGNKVQRKEGGETEVQRTTVKQGNSITAIDPYNFIYDISVDPVNLNSMGEFFAIPELHTPFRVMSMLKDKKIFGIDRFMSNDGETIIGSLEGQAIYYESKPEIDFLNFEGQGGTDWFDILSGGIASLSKEVGSRIEIINVHIAIVPDTFGLNESKNYEIWRLTLISDKFIVNTERLNNAHGMLPCAIGMPRQDGFKTKTKTFSETLMPLGKFASHEMNVHQRAARKALYGVTIYNKRQAPLMEKADVLGGKVPWLPTEAGADVRKAFLQFKDTPDTQSTMNNVNKAIELMDQMIPADILKQVASLERATSFQAAATVQGANRRPFKFAKILNVQAFVELKRIQVLNVMQFMEVIEVWSDEQGKYVELTTKQFNETDIEDVISQGIKGIDKLIYVELLRDVINMMLQSQVAQQDIDIIGIIDYWTNLFGDKVNFAQFRFKSKMDALPVEQRDQAFQLFQQAQAEQPGTEGVVQPTNGTVNPNASQSAGPGTGL